MYKILYEKLRIGLIILAILVLSVGNFYSSRFVLYFSTLFNYDRNAS